MEKYEKVNRTNKKEIIINNFIGGIAWGLGVTVGLSIIFGILSFILNQINLIPVIGTFVSQIIDFISNNNPSLQ